MKLLLIEDDRILGDGIRAGLRQQGFAVDWVRSAEDAQSVLQTAENEGYALLVLDLGLPGMSGLALLKKIRGAGHSTPVLILTARDTIKDRVDGLDSGADDYLIKPFSIEELGARLRALTRRSKGRSASTLVHGDLLVNPSSHQVLLKNQEVELSPREFAILQELLENSGRVMSREKLEEQLYGWNEEIESNAVEVHIHHLRRKLGSQLIRTIRGVGYMIESAE